MITGESGLKAVEAFFRYVFSTIADNQEDKVKEIILTALSHDKGGAILYIFKRIHFFQFPCSKIINQTYGLIETVFTALPNLTTAMKTASDERKRIILYIFIFLHVILPIHHASSPTFIIGMATKHKTHLTFIFSIS